ncbi:MAG: ABC transporter permease [Eubacterium sp.]|nr:ABC transporter permease [Eubacterium sp.]
MIQTFKMALKSIGSNKLRAFLTMLGIIIGVMALVILVSLVNGTTNTVTDKISSLGTNSMTVTISDNKGYPLYMDDLEEWKEKKEIGEVAPYQSENITAKYKGTTSTLSVYGVTPAYYDVQGLKLLLGRFIKKTDLDNHVNVCVINETAASELLGYSDVVGETISISGISYKIVGVLEDDDNSLTSVFKSGSRVAYIPYTSLIRLTTDITKELTSIYVTAADGYTSEETEEVVTELLMKRLEQDEDAFEVSTTDALEETMSSVTSVLAMLLGGIAAISLIVGGIGIMNIMLVTVTERTREIGIRKAIGADRKVILEQFLMEAVVLCMIGCLIGIFLSWVVLRVISIVVSDMNMAFNMNIMVVIVAVVFCFMIGIIFGLYPANKAAKMKPIDALHYGG